MKNFYRASLFVCAALFTAASLWAKPAATEKAAAAPQAEEEAFSRADFLQSVNETAIRHGMNAAITLFETIPDSEKNDYALRYLHSSLLLSANRAKEAEPIAEQLLAENPQDTDVLFLNVYIAKSLGNKNKKSNYLKTIIRIEPNNAEANAELGNEMLASKAYNEAAKYFLKSIQANPSYATALLGYGEACYYLGKFSESRTAFNRILAKTPEEDIVWSYLAKVEIEEGNVQQAIEDIQKAIEYNPNYYDYWIEYGNYLRGVGEREQAVEAWTKAISINPQYFLAYVYRAAVYELLEDYDAAIEDYRTIVKLNPKYQYAYESIGMLAWRAGNWKECREACQQAANINPDNLSYPLTIAACYYKEGARNSAREYLSKRMRNVDRSTPEYSILRFYYDGIGESDVMRKIRAIDNKNTQSKYLYYMAVFYEINGGTEMARSLYLEITDQKAPMFYEYRLATWALEKYGLAQL